MSEPASSKNSLFNPGELMFVLFKHKWVLITCALGGLGLAAAVFRFHTPEFESNAKLLVRYVLERSAIDSVQSAVGTVNSGKNSDSIIRSEVEILTSWDLAMQVAEAVGPSQLLHTSATVPTTVEAASAVRRNLRVEPLKGSNVISVSYRNNDPKLAVAVLKEVVQRYFDKHLEVHRSAGAFEFVAKQADEVRTRLDRTEEQIKQIKTGAHIISMPDSMAALHAAIAKAQEELYTAELEKAEQNARVKELARWLAAGDGTLPVPQAEPDEADVQLYDLIVRRIAEARDARIDLLTRYTPENKLVQANASQLSNLDKQRAQLEAKSPKLADRHVAPGSGRSPAVDLSAESTRMVAIEARALALAERLTTLRALAQGLSEVAPRISQLERKRDVEETNYKYFEASLERARVDEALDPSKIPNISIIQKPSPAQSVTSDVTKQALAVAGGSAGLGVMIVLVAGVVLNQTVKRSAEFEGMLRIPLLAAIPLLKARNSAFARHLRGDFTGRLRQHVQVLAERITLRLGNHSVASSPKLIGITSCSSGAGVTTMAMDLAGALAETGERVLVVDIANSEVREFSSLETDPSPTRPLSDVFQAKNSAHDETLTVVRKSPYPALARVHELVVDSRAGEFGYILFDLPPGNNSVTFTVAPLVDHVLLIVVAEKDSRKTVAQLYGDLAATRVEVSAVLNQASSYMPAWLADLT